MTRKNLLVTGGSRGIGHSVAVLAAQNGWDVCVNYVRNEASAAKTVGLVEKHGGRAIAVQADITQEADIVNLFGTCADQLGSIDGMVNSAGIVEPYGRLDDLKYDELLPLIDINVTAALICAREAVKHMSTKHGGNGGAIVLLSSAASRLGAPGFCVPYAASKAAVDALGWGLAQEVSREDIRVNVVSPGVIDTDIQPPGRVEETGPKLPAGRVGQPEEVAETIIWLLSEKASYVSGANLAVSYAR